ncbi:PAAR domain-containing protein [Pseudescherichia vulneris]
MERMKGFYLKVGDESTCGGIITSGCVTALVSGNPSARMGDNYRCGADGKTYAIAGGVPGSFVEGKLAAGTGHSKGTCRCKCEFVPVGFALTYGYKTEVTAPSNKIIPLTPDKEHSAPVDAGFCVLPHESSPAKHDSLLFMYPPANVRQLYSMLNPEMTKKPGSILIVVDPDKQVPEQIEILQNARDRIDTALAPLTAVEAKILYENRAAIDIFSSQIYSDALGTAGDIAGYVSEVGQSYYEEINNVLEEIQMLYQKTYNNNSGVISGQEFFGQRQRLFNKLNVVLNRYSKSQLNLREYENIKKALGLSTHSIMHRWDQSGIGSIEGYASYIEKSAKLIKVMRKTGYVGIGLDFASYSSNVYDACAIGREDACRKVAMTEYSKFGGKQLAGAVAGSVAGWASRGACMWVLGLASSEVGGIGSAMCLVTGIGFSIGTSKFTEDSGEKMGDKLGRVIYEHFIK